jgi:hypothetical protein
MQTLLQIALRRQPLRSQANGSELSVASKATSSAKKLDQTHEMEVKCCSKGNLFSLKEDQMDERSLGSVAPKATSSVEKLDLDRMLHCGPWRRQQAGDTFKVLIRF